MIRKTRWRLTLLYSSIIGLTLLTMVGVFYLSLLQVVRHHEEAELNRLAEQRLSHELKKHIGKMLLQGKEHNLETKAEHRQPASMNLEVKDDENGFDEDWKDRDAEPFFMLLDHEGNLMVQSLQDEGLLNWLLPQLRQWPEEDVGKVKWMFRVMANDQPNHAYALVAHPFAVELCGKHTAKGEFYGTLFVGEEVTDYWQLLRRMRTLLLFLAVGLLLVAAGIGYAFSARAMIPIIKAYRQQQTFLADASHELRTPISIIQSSVEILEEIKPNIPSFHQQVLDDMTDEVKRMGRLVQDLLFLARSDTGELQLQKEPFDFAQTCRAATERMKNVARKKGVELTCHIPERPVWLIGDRERLCQMLYIFLDNAIKYTSQGGQVRISLTQHPNGWIDCTVQDTGVGIPEADLPHIFERFYRADKHRSRAMGGTGLGLSIADWIVKSHGGKISVTSQVGKGTTFRIHLPPGQPKDKGIND